VVVLFGSSISCPTSSQVSTEMVTLLDICYWPTLVVLQHSFLTTFLLSVFTICCARQLQNSNNECDTFDDLMITECYRTVQAGF